VSVAYVAVCEGCGRTDQLMPEIAGEVRVCAACGPASCRFCESSLSAAEATAGTCPNQCAPEQA
jgi:rRNA maturation endonuclease Nob1